MSESNRVRAAAFEVLKEYALAVKVEQTGPNTAADFKLSAINIPDDNASEVGDALVALRRNVDAIEIRMFHGRDQGRWNLECTVDARKVSKEGDPYPNLTLLPSSVHFNPVGNMAQEIADAGVNFPGSEKFKSRKVAV